MNELRLAQLRAWKAREDRKAAKALGAERDQAARGALARATKGVDTSESLDGNDEE